jgi:hypothetical protein
MFARTRRASLMALFVTIAVATAASASTPGWQSPFAERAGFSALRVSASATSALYPGGTGDVLIRFSNPNPYPVTVMSVSVSGTNAEITADAGHSACTTTGVSFTDQSALSIRVPAKVNGVDGMSQATLSRAVAMSNRSLSSCQGAVFRIPLAVSGIEPLA